MMSMPGLNPLSKAIEDPSCWYLGEQYFDALYEAIGDEPGLLFWDIANEPGATPTISLPGMTTNRCTSRITRNVPTCAAARAARKKTWAIVRHFCKYVKAKDPEHDIGVGNIYIYETEHSGTAELVDVIVFHDYFCTRRRIREMLDMAVALGKKYNKPVLNNEMCCLCRANPYDMSIELHNEYKIGWYLFELMIGQDMWSRVHGVVYPDGTVRDPSIVAAIYGFYRNRGETAIRSDVNQEDYVTRVMILADRTLKSIRQSQFGIIPTTGKICWKCARCRQSSGSGRACTHGLSSDSQDCSLSPAGACGHSGNCRLSDGTA